MGSGLAQLFFPHRHTHSWSKGQRLSPQEALHMVSMTAVGDGEAAR